MRGFFVAVLVLAILVSVALWGVISYRNQQSYDTGMIGVQATRVIKVDIGSLTRHIGWNAFWHPGYYAEEERAAFMEKRKMIRTGLASVAKIFLFQLGDEPFWTTFTYGIVPLADAENFTQFLQTELYMQVGQDSISRFGRHKHAFVRYDDRQAVFALGNFDSGSDELTDGLIKNQLASYLTGEQLVSIKASPFYDAVTQEGHIVSVGRERLSIEFLEGEIVFSCALEQTTRAAVAYQPSVWADSSLLRLRASLTDWIPKGDVFSVGTFVLHSDSLRAYMAGDVVGEWRGMGTQTDSVITWEFDDNLEMMEVVERIEQPVPDLYLSVQTHADALQRYLVDNGILDSASEAVNPAFFPLFRVYWQQEGSWLTFHTQHPRTELEEAPNASPLYVAANIRAIKQHVTFPKVRTFLTPFRELVISADQEPQGIVLRGRIAMEDNTVSSLMQLLVREQG